MSDGNAYNDGYTAAYWQKPSKDNPYPREDPRNAEWYRGWCGAKEDMAIPPTKYG